MDSSGDTFKSGVVVAVLLACSFRLPLDGWLLLLIFVALTLRAELELLVFATPLEPPSCDVMVCGILLERTT